MKYERIDDPCGQCTLEKDAQKAKGFKGAKILVVTKAPRYNQDHPLSPQALAVFSGEAKKHGFRAQDFIFHNAIRCSFDPGEYETKEKHNIQKSCREWLVRAIERHKPDLIIGLGADAASAVEGRKVQIMKARGAKRIENVCKTNHSCHVFYMLDPDFVSMYPQHKPTFAIDFKSLKRLVDSGYDIDKMERESHGNYKIVDDLQFLIDLDPTYLDFDIEAIGLKHCARGAKILTMQFCVAPGEAYAVVWDHPERKFPRDKRKKMIRQLRELLCSPKRQLIGQNLKFDAVWMLAKLGIRIRIFWDTLMLFTLLDENSKDKGQDMLVKQFVPEMAGYADAFNNKYDKGRLDLVPLGELVEYGCGDVDSNLRLFHALLPLVKKDKLLMRHYRHVSRPALNAFVPIEAEGQLVSEDNLDRFQLSLEQTIKEQKSSIVSRIDPGLARKWLRKHQETGLSMGRRDFLRDILFQDPRGCHLIPRVYTKSTEKLAPDKRKASTSTKDHLPFFFEDPEHGRFVADLAQHLKDQRLYDSNVISFREKYLYNGKIYPNYSLTTAVTGRCLTADAEVVTNFGVMTMEEIGEAFRTRRNPGGGLFMALTHEGRLRPITDFVANGVREVFEVTTRNGHTLTATGNHPFLTDDGWVDLSDLSIGDRVFSYPHGARPEPAEEEWRDIEGHEFYEVSNHGRVRFKGGTDKWHKEARIVKPHRKGQWGHVKVRLGRDGGDGPVHRLVAKAFLGPCPEGAEVEHINGLPADNRAVNLRYATSQDNSDTAVVQGRTRRGALHNWTKYPDSLVEKVRRCRLRTGKSYAEIGRKFGLDYRYVRELCLGLKHKRKPRVFDNDEIVSIVHKGREETFDISVQDDHSFVANSLIVHNTASRDPNGQNFPKRGENAKVYRSIFVPPPGWVLLECDLSQAELRIAADMANEETMLEIYREGGDIHRATACMVMGITEEQFYQLPKSEQKLARYKAKAVNFGYIYGMGWRKFIIYAKTQYGVDYTDEEAQNIRDGYFRMFFNLPEWHRAMRSFARTNKHVRSYSGRIRHLPMVDSPEEYIQQEAERQAINSPVQEFGSSYGLMSMGRIDQEVDRRYLKLIGFVHDALYAYVPAKYVEWGAKKLKYYMESNNIKKWFGLDLACPILAEVGFGLDGSNMIELGALQLGKKFDWQKEVYDTEDWKKAQAIKLPPQKRPPNDGHYDLPEYMDLKHVS